MNKEDQSGPSSDNENPSNKDIKLPQQNSNNNKEIGDTRIDENYKEFFRGALSLIERFAYDEKHVYEKAQRYPMVFEIDEEFLAKLHKRVIERFLELELLQHDKPVFLATVRFSDLGTQNFRDFQQLLDKAGDKKDPESLVLRWSGVVYNPIPSLATIELQFITEQRLEVEELNLMSHSLSSMYLTIGGPTEDWVDKTFAIIHPFMDAAKLGGIYKPLFVFRNPHFVQITAIGVGVILQILTSQLLARALHKENISLTSVRDQIISIPDLADKFNAYIKWLFEKPVEESIAKTMLPIVIGFMVFAVSLVLAYLYLPKLVPKSTIGIGLAKRRIARYQNAFKFIVFTVIIGGILIPLLLNLLLEK